MAKGSNNIKIEKTAIANDKGASFGLGGLGANIKAAKNYEATVEDSTLLGCIDLENLLKDRADFFDSTIRDDVDISTLSRGHIIKFDSTIVVPEQFDLTHTIIKFKPQLTDSIGEEVADEEKEAFQSFIQTTNPKVPIVLEAQDFPLCAKIELNNLFIDYVQLEEFESTDVTILARLLSSGVVSSSKALFDSLKDFMVLNRTIRRSMAEKRPEGLHEIFCDEDYKNIEILAIYH